MATKYKVKNGRFGEFDAGAKLTESELTKGGWNLKALLARGVVVELDGENEEIVYVSDGDDEQQLVIAMAEADALANAVNITAPQPVVEETVPSVPEAITMSAAEKRAATLAAKRQSEAEAAGDNGDSNTGE